MFDIADIYPLAPACSGEPHTAQGTPVHGTTLLHVAAHFDEVEIAEWLLDRGMNPDARSAIDVPTVSAATPRSFSTVVSQHNFWVNYGKGQPDQAQFTRAARRGADPNIRAASPATPRKKDTGWLRFASIAT